MPFERLSKTCFLSLKGMKWLSNSVRKFPSGRQAGGRTYAQDWWKQGAVEANQKDLNILNPEIGFI